MGLISFVKNAGAKLFKKKEAATSSVKNAVNKGSEQESAAPSQEELESQKAVELEGLVNSMGFGIEDLYIEVSGDVATVHGKTGSWDDKERAVLAVGNVEGIAQVDDRIEILATESQETGEGNREVPAVHASDDSSSEASEYYTVKKGDSLSKISKQVYGNAMKYRIIFEANKPMLKDPNKIYPGQVLRIPPLTNA